MTLKRAKILSHIQGQIQGKFEGGAVGGGGAVKFSEIFDEITPYTTISDPNY